jgi:transposase InsO family protein
VAQVLARAGWRVSARSVRRIGREKGSKPAPTTPTGERSRHPVVARFANHVWMMDVSVIQTFLGGELYLASVFDAFSRAPLAISTHEHKPGASAMARLLRMAARTFGSPKYLITDQGREFTGKVFAKAVARLGIVQRFGSTQNIFATARIERFWRTPCHRYHSPRPHSLAPPSPVWTRHMAPCSSLQAPAAGARPPRAKRPRTRARRDTTAPTRGSQASRLGRSGWP